MQRHSSWIRLHWDEGWQFRGLSTDGKILWRWQQCPFFHANHPKPLKDQVKEGNLLNLPGDYLIILSFTDSHQTTGTMDLGSSWSTTRMSVATSPATQVWKCIKTDINSDCFYRPCLLEGRASGLLRIFVLFFGFWLPTPCVLIWITMAVKIVIIVIIV